MGEQILKKLEQHDERFDIYNQKFTEHDKRFDAIDKKLEQHDERFDRHGVRMDEMTEAILENRALIEDVREKVKDLPSKEYWDKMYALLDKNAQDSAKQDVETTMIKHGLKRVTDKVEEHDVDIRKIKEKIGK